jgi:Ca2+-binding RTX toxin-like protein
MYDQADRARTGAHRPGLLERLGLLGEGGKRRRKMALSLSVATSLLFGGFVTTSGGLPSSAAVIGSGFEVNTADLAFILQQIRIAENNVVARRTAPTQPCAGLVGSGVNQIPEVRLPFGLRTVDGSCNHLEAGTERYGAADTIFPRMTAPMFITADQFDPDGAGPIPPVPGTTTYNSTSGVVADADPRLVSNLIVDQTDANPAAVAASGGCFEREGADLDGDLDPDTCFTGNVAPDVGLSAPFNSMFTFFGQFFDHGLDLVNKGGSGTVFVPLLPDDPLYNEDLDGPDNDFGANCGGPGATVACDDNAFNFLTLTRGSNVGGNLNDDNNQTTSYVDQNQTYTSHPSHQVFLRDYDLVNLPGDAFAGAVPVSSGHLLDGAILGNIANWGEVKAQAANVLGIRLTDADVGNVPMLMTDAYGQFVPGPARGLPQVMTATGPVEGDTAAPVSLPANVVRTNHAFLDDIAHNAAPSGRAGPLAPDGDGVVNPIFEADGVTPALRPSGTYDDELLAAHFITGDGRGNENIGLTSVHTIFHSEHNRLAHEIDTMIKALPVDDPLRVGFEAYSAAPGGSGWWYGDRLFQAARFVTEMEYQHLVFEEFARTLAPSINIFIGDGINFQSQVNPAITAEFAHAVYRFGHSMLNAEVARTDPETGQAYDMSLFEAFLNPTAFNDDPASATPWTAAEAAGAVFQGGSRQVGNEIDEFVTDTLRNQLLGRPLDLATLNIARGRSEGIPPLNVVRQQLFTTFGHASLAPYGSWDDFMVALRNSESIVNFIAAYGTHPLITAESTVERRRAAGNAIVNGAPYAGADGVLGDAPGTPIVGDESLDDVAGSPALAGPDGVLGDDPLTPCVTTGLPGDPVGCDEGADDIPAVPAGPGADGVQGDDPLTPITGDESADDILPPADGDDFYFGTGAWSGVETGLNTIDLWMGGLAERPNPFGGMLGSTFNWVFEIQLENLQNADRFYYLERLDGLNLLAQLEGNSFAELIMRNTNARAFSGVVFSRPGLVYTIHGPTNVTDETGAPAGEPEVSFLSGDRIRYNGAEHVIWDGSEGADNVISNEGDDTFWGRGGNDRFQGGAGNDQPLGGEGDDIITDTFGDDVMKGGPGNDVITGGPGLDLLQGNAGDDFIVAGNDFTESFGGDGDDVIFTGDSATEAFAGAGDDWMEGGGQLDLLVGDENNQFQDDPNGGHDVIIGGPGDDDYDSEGGDDVMVADVLGTERLEGMLGFDWVTYRGDTRRVDADMRIPLALPPQVIELRDRFDKTEALSGYDQNDTLRGDDRGCPPQDAAAGLCLVDPLAEGTVVGHELTQAGIDRIVNLRPVLVQAVGPEVNGANYTFDDGNILLGGAGSDVIEGRGGNDIIDGDRWLNVQLSAGGGLYNSLTEFQAAVVSGAINPGTIDIVRTVEAPSGAASDCLSAAPVNCDTAAFTGAPGEYRFVPDANNDGLPDAGATLVRVTHIPDPLNPAVIGPDGVDVLFGIERFMFLNNTPDVGGDDVIIDPNVDVEFSVAPAAVDFGTIIVGFGQGTQVVTVTNDGSSPMSVIDTTLAADPPAADHPPFPFAIVDSTCDDGPVSPAGTCTVTVVFTVSPEVPPAVETADVYDTTLTVNVQGALSQTVPITGEAIDPILGTNGPDGTAAARFQGTAEDDVIFTLGGADFVAALGGNDIVDGGNGADDITLGAGNDRGIGGAGNDTIAGQGGNDTFVFTGTNGDFDTIVGGAGVDTIVAEGPGPVTIGLVSIATIEAITGAIESVPVTILGNNAANTWVFTNVTLTNIAAIDGAGGADVITGSAAADNIIGGAGNDSLNGGAGNDTFRIVGTANFGTDLINGFDFTAAGGQDVIRFPAGTAVTRQLVGTEVRLVTSFGTVRIAGANALANITLGADYFIG